VSLRLLAFDRSAELFEEAITCLAAVPPAERDPLEPEIRLLHAQALFYGGRLVEAERELREGIETALRAGTLASQLAEWVEPLIIAMRVVGPRPSLVTQLIEVAERCHATGMVEVEILVQALIAEFYHERNLPVKARLEAHRAATLARRLPSGPLQALALLGVAISRTEGTVEEQRLASRFLAASRLLLGRARRWELDHLAADVEARLLEARGDLAKARELRERAIPALQRAKLPAIEVYQQLGIAENLLTRSNPKGLDAPLGRAGTIIDMLHLLPPSPALLRYWLLDGRRLAISDSSDEARDRWQALIDLPTGAALPRQQAEATVRLALLEYSHGNTEAAARLSARLEAPELVAALPASWASWIPKLAELAAGSEHGGGPLPPRPAPDRPPDRERRNRPRR
jgi:tetratricopeptide (TPR) repeat protein